VNIAQNKTRFVTPSLTSLNVSIDHAAMEPPEEPLSNAKAIRQNFMQAKSGRMLMRAPHLPVQCRYL